jgi:hypothetical protein
MATVKRYSVFCQKCNQKFPIFAMLPHTVNVNNWMKDKADNHDCKAYADQLAKERAPRPINPLKAPKKGAGFGRRRAKTTKSGAGFSLRLPYTAREAKAAPQDKIYGDENNRKQ